MRHLRVRLSSESLREALAGEAIMPLLALSQLDKESVEKRKPISEFGAKAEIAMRPEMRTKKINRQLRRLRNKGR